LKNAKIWWPCRGLPGLIDCFDFLISIFENLVRKKERRSKVQKMSLAAKILIANDLEINMKNFKT
jgi:hypothetical protein